MPVPRWSPTRSTVRFSPPAVALTRLDGFPDIRVVVRADWDRSRVAIVSGGGAGHEPAHVGFVGRGMLTAAVCGDVFASPEHRCGAGRNPRRRRPRRRAADRQELHRRPPQLRPCGRARARHGHGVEMVIVGDDVALPTSLSRAASQAPCSSTRSRGMWRNGRGSRGRHGCSCNRRGRSTASIGMALTTCTVPGARRRGRAWPSDEAELGLGIHGEPGAERIPLGSSARHGRSRAGSPRCDRRENRPQPLALLINNLGGLPPIEMALVTKQILDSPLGAARRTGVRACAADDLARHEGVFASRCCLSTPRRAALLAPVGAQGLAAGSGRFRCLLPLPEPSRPSIRPRRGSSPRADRRGRKRAASGFGVDSPDRSRRRTEPSRRESRRRRYRHHGGACGGVDRGRSRHACDAEMGRHAVRHGPEDGPDDGRLERRADLDLSRAPQGRPWARVPLGRPPFGAGSTGCHFYGGANEGDRTMIDALAPAIAVMEAGGGLAAMAAAARAGAERTANITPDRRRTIELSAGKPICWAAGSRSGGRGRLAANPGRRAKRSVAKAAASSSAVTTRCPRRRPCFWRVNSII